MKNGKIMKKEIRKQKRTDEKYECRAENEKND